MKKVFRSIIFTLTCLALVLLVGCGKTEVKSEQKTNAKTLEPTQTTTTVHVHAWNDGEVTTPATCTEKGVKTFSCACGETKTEEIAALGHDLVDDEAIPATCTAPGKEAGKHCSRCEYTEGGAVVEALGHNYEKVDAVAATHDAFGVAEHYECSRCHVLALDENGSQATTDEELKVDKLVRVSFNTNGGSEINPVDVVKGTKASALAQVTTTKEGHTFEGWYLNDAKLLGEEEVSEDITVTANWTINTYTVVWANADDSVLETDNEVQYGATPEYNGEDPVKAADENYTYYFKGWDKEIVAASENVTYKAVFDAKLNWLIDNNMSVSEGTIDLDHKVVLNAGSTENGAGSPAKAEGYLGYVAYDGNYGAGDFVVVDFTGNNMPAISFMRNTIADDYTNGENIQADKYKAITLFNGYTDATGADGWKMDALYLTGLYGIANIGGGPGFNVQQYLMDKVSEDFGMLDLASSTTKYRMIAGISSIADNTTTVGFNVAVAIINLDTNEVVLNIKKSYSAPSAEGYGVEGKIQIFGVYGKEITLDKIYTIEENTTLSALLLDAEVKEWFDENNMVLDDAVVDANHKVVLSAGSTANGAGSPAKAEGYLGYVAYDGNYGAGDFVVVDFTGNNMPAISFMRSVIADDYTNGENIQAAKYKAITLFNGYTDATGADAWKWDALYLTGLYGIANIGGGHGFNVQQYLMEKVSEDFGMLDLASSTTKYRMIAGISSITDNGDSVDFTISVAIINLDTNEVVLKTSNSYNAPSAEGYGTEGKIQIFGVYGKAITLDKVYAVEENTSLDALVTKYTPEK